MIKYIGGINRTYDYVMVADDGGDEEYVPAMVITRDRCKGRSFIITLNALWKYDEPINNRNQAVVIADQNEFYELMKKIEGRELLAVTPGQKVRAGMDHICVEFAWLLNAKYGFLLCTAYNLFKCMQILDISPVPQAAAQLLMWIQDGLDKLKDMPEHQGSEYTDESKVVGDMVIFNAGEKIGSSDIEIKHSEMVREA
uniref:Uncharacterized protein n=1 Tax=viral metagenome TaxID=1070528 RepID=A0A6M3KZW5_9ZZZZ